MSKEKNLSDIWKLKKRARRDSKRHKELIKEALKNNSNDIINEYEVITTDGSKKIKVPIKFLEHYKIKYGKLKGKGGVGQGVNGKKGSKYKVGNKKKPGSGGEPGDEEGELVFEAEITVDEMVDILIEDINLPWLKENLKKKITIKTEEIESVQKVGIMPNLDIKRTIMNNIKKNIATKSNKIIGNFSKEDLRYKAFEPVITRSSEANIYLMMDRSGSMSKERTKKVKVFYFWLIQLLKRKYNDLNIYFIAHDTTAKLVDQKDFFKISSAGGTRCSSAFAMAYEHIKDRYTDDSNNYVFEFSDGDNTSSDNLVCLEYIKKMYNMVNYIGYGEVKDDNDAFGIFSRETLYDFLKSNFNEEKLFLTKMTQETDIIYALKIFFGNKE